MCSQLVIILAEKGFITLDVEYIDGTKIESKANKYTFVWRKTTEKNRARLMAKIKALLEQVDEAIAQENARDDNGQDFTPAEPANLMNMTGNCASLASGTPIPKPTLTPRSRA